MTKSRPCPCPCPLLLFTFFAVSAFLLAQEQHHHHGEGDSKTVNRPRVFLDKSPRIVWYQLNRLDNARLLLVERATDDPKYKPVYTAILTRAGMSRHHREEALQGLVKLNDTDTAAELLTALQTLDGDDRQQQRVGRQLASLLLRQPQSTLKKKVQALQQATGADSSILRTAGYAGLVAAGEQTSAWTLAQKKPLSLLDYLAAVRILPGAEMRSSLRESILDSLDESNPQNVRRAAIGSLAFVPTDYDPTFRLIARYVSKPPFRTAAVRTLLRIPREHRNADTARELLAVLVKHAETTPAEMRTTDEFIDAMQLADQLLALLPVDAARVYRERLREITVRVIRIHTVEEEMRYDIRFFAVEAGRPVQVVLKNEDLMPHNLVITVPEALKEVALEGALLGPNPGFEGKQYVPDSDKVLFATGMVQASQQERLTFKAPSEPAEYPFVCTFPRHWMRMYGVMVVVDDLDVWLKQPIEPKDPIGNTRTFVKSWTVDDFKADLETGLRGRSPEIGQRLFTEATCAQCHKVNGQGGAVGPELSDVFKRWKGDHAAVLREILDPSHQIDPKYAVQVIITLDGKVVSGIVKAEDKTSVSVLVNPEAPQPTVIQRAEIDEIVKSSKSMMPKALLDRFTKDEIFELLSYVEYVQTVKKGP